MPNQRSGSAFVLRSLVVSSSSATFSSGGEASASDSAGASSGEASGAADGFSASDGVCLEAGASAVDREKAILDPSSVNVLIASSARRHSDNN